MIVNRIVVMLVEYNLILVWELGKGMEKKGKESRKRENIKESGRISLIW